MNIVVVKKISLETLCILEDSIVWVSWVLVSRTGKIFWSLVKAWNEGVISGELSALLRPSAAIPLYH